MEVGGRGCCRERNTGPDCSGCNLQSNVGESPVYRRLSNRRKIEDSLKMNYDAAQGQNLGQSITFELFGLFGNSVHFYSREND